MNWVIYVTDSEEKKTQIISKNLISYYFKPIQNNIKFFNQKVIAQRLARILSCYICLGIMLPPLLMFSHSLGHLKYAEFSAYAWHSLTRIIFLCKTEISSAFPKAMCSESQGYDALKLATHDPKTKKVRVEAVVLAS